VQTTCPHCSQGLTIDDSKIPDRAYSLKCPRCQNSVRFLGKGMPPQPASEPATAVIDDDTLPSRPIATTPATQTAGAPSAPTVPATEEVRAQILAQMRREIAMGEPTGAGRAIVVLPDRERASATTSTLARLGFAVETIDDGDEAARLVEQGTCTLLAATKTVAGTGLPPTLYQRLNRLSTTARRRVFVLLVGDEFKSGDGTQAFTVCADLVVHPRDLGTFDNLLHVTMGERQRLYQAYLDARLRFEASS
jgi:predicted Zn finger-like uncharacterized protein